MELRFGAHLWGLEGVVRRKVNVEEENAAGVGIVRQIHYVHVDEAQMSVAGGRG